MEHEMNLWDGSFLAIKNGVKTVEMRLNDEKRKILKTHDIIIFTNTNSKEKLKVEILSLDTYKDFFELYRHYDKISIGYKENQIANPEDMYDYYTKEEINKYGVLAITLKVL